MTLFGDGLRARPQRDGAEDPNAPRPRPCAATDQGAGGPRHTLGTTSEGRHRGARQCRSAGLGAVRGDPALLAGRSRSRGGLPEDDDQPAVSATVARAGPVEAAPAAGVPPAGTLALMRVPRPGALRISNVPPT